MHGFDMALGVLDQHAGMAEALAIGEAALLDRMAGGIEPLEQRRIEAAFELETRRAGAPGLAEEPARRIDRRGEILAGAVARQDLRLELRLAVSATTIPLINKDNFKRCRAEYTAAYTWLAIYGVAEADSGSRSPSR